MARGGYINSLNIQDGSDFRFHLVDDGGGVENDVDIEKATYRDGWQITNENVQGRDIVYNISVHGTSEADFQDNLATLQAALDRCMSPFFGKLKVEDHDGNWRVIDKAVFKKMQRAYTNYNNTWITYEVVFVSERARWYTETDTTVTVSPSTGLYQGTLSVSGEGRPEPQLNFRITTANGTNRLIYRNLTTNQYFDIDYSSIGTIAGLLTVDCKEKTVVLNGEDIISEFEGIFPEFAIGDNDYVIQTFGNGVNVTQEQFEYGKNEKIVNDGTYSYKLAQSFVADASTSDMYFMLQLRRMNLTELGSLTYSIVADSSGDPTGTVHATGTIALNDNFFTDMKTNAPYFRIIKPTLSPGLTSLFTYWIVLEFASSNGNVVAWDKLTSGLTGKKNTGVSWFSTGQFVHGVYLGAGSLTMSHFVTYGQNFNSVD